MIWGSIEGGEGLGVRMLPLGAPGFKGPSILIVYRVCVAMKTCGLRF